MIMENEKIESWFQAAVLRKLALNKVEDPFDCDGNVWGCRDICYSCPEALYSIPDGDKVKYVC